ncbi:hypothetical protein HK104_009598 [Borealophlyctis nickersoniae]|nr:hypothetical protein HK104_009598 [Borealophlyctis nickersoniae]
MNRSSSLEANRRGLPTRRPSPIVPYELIRLIAQCSAPTPAARVRRLDRKISQLITTADLVLVKALKLWREYDLYTTLVKWGASPKAPNLLLASVYAGTINVLRAMKAAGGAEDLRVLYKEDQLLQQLEDIRLFKFLFDEMGFDPALDMLLSEAVSLGYLEHAAYLVTRGANPSAIKQSVIRSVVRFGDHKTLEWLVESVHLPSNEILADALASGFCAETRDFLKAVHFLLRRGADPHFVRDDETVLELAVKKELWKVADLMLAEMDSRDVENYQLLKAIVAGDKIGTLLWDKDPNAFNGAPLRLAAARSKPATVKRLLDHGAVPTESALRAACSVCRRGRSEEKLNRNIATILQLLPVTQNFDVQSLIQRAQRAGNIAVCKF